MKILMISPSSGGIDVYVNRLSEILREHNILVDIDGSTKEESAFDVAKREWLSSDRVKEIVSKIASRIDFDKYDSVIFHYGKNDIEQYLPVVLSNIGKKINNPIYFTHFLSRNLFSQYLKDDKTQKEVEKAVCEFFKSYLFFGTFARKYMEKQSGNSLSGVVSFLPETHSHEILSESEIREFKNTFNHSESVPTVYLPGFPANYKDHEFLVNSLTYVNKKMRLVIAGRGWYKKLGFDKKIIGKAEIYVVDKYLNSKEYKYLSSYSAFGIFPYRQPDGDEIFQGSGTIPNFIYEGKACLGLNEASVPEYIGSGGIITLTGDTKLFAEAIDKLLDPKIRRIYELESEKRRDKFSIETHAKEVISLLNSTIK
ncbi:MAG: hypothetical protein UW29_C0013G0005 [Candidatus Collierbacteria bacterium GW2011_GWC2_44_13]|nr:MAG: hypothetical protein UW29_C0013G0005 [Candidatus Collierbacteria bacterium GW2011_GWC2_44_13]